MAAVLRPLAERTDGAALDELEALREAIAAEKARVADAHRRWLLTQASLTTADPAEARVARDAEYIQLLERQNALLKKRIVGLEELNRNLNDEKAQILQATEPSRPLPQAAPSLLSSEVARLSEQCRSMRRESEQHLREIAAKDAELGTLRTQVHELTLTLRTKEEDIAHLSQLKSETMIRARKGGEGELERTAEERRKAVEELISARATIERLQRDLGAAQEEARSASGDLRAVRAAAEAGSVAARQADEALKEVAPGEGLSVADKAAAAVQALRRARAELQAEQGRRHAAELLLLEQRSEAEARLRAEAEAARRLQETQAAELAESEQRVAALVEQLAALGEARRAHEAEAERKAADESALGARAADESAMAERAALEELLGEAQARVAELEAKEARHADELRGAREGQQRAQIALAEQLAAAEAALTEERAQAARLTAERERLLGEAAARRRTELPVVAAAAEVQGLDKAALYARLQELFYVEAAERLLAK